MARARVVVRSSLECPSSCNNAEYDGLRAEGGGRMSRSDKLPRHTFPSSHAFPELVYEANWLHRRGGGGGTAESPAKCRPF